jgi:hypothetical protein
VRLTHWVEQAYSEADVVRIAALVGVARLPWEDAATFRSRLIPLVASRLRGSVGPLDIAQFAFEYLRAAEGALGRPGEQLPAVLVPGLQQMADAPAAFAASPKRPRYLPLAMVENPRRQRQSPDLADMGNRVAHLRHWIDTNEGLFDAPVRLTFVGAAAGRTSVPIVVNLTTGAWIGYLGVVPVGRTLVVETDDAGGGLAGGWLDTADVTPRLIGGAAFPPGDDERPAADRAIEAPAMPVMRRGPNEWMYLSAGHYGIRGVDRTFFAFASAVMAEATFDRTAFDRSIFPVGPAVSLALEWVEDEPASFEVHVPGGLLVEPGSSTSLADEVHAALASSIDELRAAGVAAALVVDRFTETQSHRPQMQPSWVTLPAEAGPTGTEVEFTVGGRFGDTAFGTTRFE